ncbi:hypothetical protein ROA7450_03988 [Roseovarius albus]|uniref:Uncharacterized protein n=1 Tax=Roseovarius albus TaxID=1247867 RepID=A0A1X7A6U9_9RHOB|nr:hypothetical protein [Roseovarius albus]SLN72109.1 hypothetical protein ROA7450_03988 [Roseovarius albus]
MSVCGQWVRVASFVAALLVALVAVSRPADAQDDAPESVSNPPEWVRASRWARENDGIAIAVRLGSDSGLEADGLRNNLEVGFAETFGVTAKAFVDQSETPGSVVMYAYCEVATEPEGFGRATAMERMQQVVDEYLVGKPFCDLD